jgi:glycosyltransferase involved in cell wall biosynthesis
MKCLQTQIVAIPIAMPHRGRVEQLAKRGSKIAIAVFCLISFFIPDRTPPPSFHISSLDPVVSIMMPTYNKGEYIVRAVLSALSQTLSDFELVISDDCSDDQTLSNLEPLIAADPRIRYWRNEERIYTNRNRVKVVRSARAEWLLCLDSDDELFNKTAEIDYATQLRTGADMVEHKALQMDWNKKILPWEFKPPPFREANNETLTKAFWNGTMNWTLWLKMIRRALYAKALDFLGPEVCELQNALGQDRLHVATMYRFVRKYVTVDYVGYIYYRNVPQNAWARSKNQDRDLGIMEKVLWNMTLRRILDPL